MLDYLLAFWGCADDYVEDEDCRNLLKCGKYVERLDLCIRLDYHKKDLEKEYRKLTNRLGRINLSYNEEKPGPPGAADYPGNGTGEGSSGGAGMPGGTFPLKAFCK